MITKLLLFCSLLLIGCGPRTFSREELDRWNPSKVDMLPAKKPLPIKIEDFRTGLWKGSHDDVSRKRGNLFLTINRKDSTLFGDFILTHFSFHTESTYGGTIEGELHCDGGISFTATITNDSGKYPINFTGEWVTDQQGIQSMYGTIKDTGSRFLLGGVWMAWHQSTN